jgi:hypothetical protein
MAELLLVANPKRRRKARKNPKRRRARRNPSHHRRRRVARRNPMRRRHRARHNPVRHYRRRARHNPVFRHRRRLRRNPSPRLGSIKSAVMPTIKAGMVGAGGALALDAAWGFVSPTVNSWLANYPSIANFAQLAAKLGVAVGVGWAGGHLLRGKGRDLAVGGATVALHDFLKTQLQSMAPTLFGAGGTFALSGYNGMGAYLSGSAPLVGTASFPSTYLPQQNNYRMGAYLSGSSGMADDGNAGVYTDDFAGQDYWQNN